MRLPSSVQFEPVGQCNLRCEMCPIQFRQEGPPYGPPAFMDFGLFTRLVDQFEGLEELHLQGLGEPMMHPRFFDMVRYATARGARVTTNSNLTLLSDRRAEACVTSGLAELHVSIDGADAETYERIRRRGHFERVLENVRRLVAVRDRLDSQTPHLQMVMVVMRQNLDQLADLVALADGLGIHDVFVQHLAHDFGEEALPAHYRPMREYVEAQTLLGGDPARTSAAFARAREAAMARDVRLRLPNTEVREHAPGTPGPERCDWPWSSAYVAWDGTAMPCCMVATPDRASLGSMADRSVVDVWDGAAYQSFRDRLASDDPPDVCRSCSLYHGTF